MSLSTDACMALKGEDVEPQLDSVVVIGAAVVISVVSVAGFLVLPLLVGAASEDLSLSDQQVGFLSSTVLLGSALSSIGAFFWVRKLDWRRAAGVTLLLLLIGHSAALASSSLLAIALGLACAGLGGGSAYSLALTILSDGSHPDRNFGISLAAQVSFQVVGLLFLPAVIAEHGLDGVLLVLLLMDALALCVVVLLPRTGRVVQQLRLSSVLKPAPFLALGGCLLFFFNVGCYWTYIERMGDAAGLSANFIGKGLSMGVVLGIVGALLAAWKVERYGRAWPLAFGALGTVMAAWLLAGELTQRLFIASVALYNFVWNYSLAYQYAAVNAVDESGCSVAVAPAFHALGAAMGPAVAGLLLVNGNFNVVVVLVSVSVILSLVMFLLAFKAQLFSKEVNHVPSK